MPRGERRLADLLLEDIGVVRFFPAGDLAGRAGVSKATAARLFRRLGYASYREAQQEVRETDGRTAAPGTRRCSTAGISVAWGISRCRGQASGADV